MHEAFTMASQSRIFEPIVFDFRFVSYGKTSRFRAQDQPRIELLDLIEHLLKHIAAHLTWVGRYIQKVLRSNTVVGSKQLSAHLTGVEVWTPNPLVTIGFDGFIVYQQSVAFARPPYPVPTALPKPEADCVRVDLPRPRTIRGFR